MNCKLNIDTISIPLSTINYNCITVTFVMGIALTKVYDVSSQCVMGIASTLKIKSSMQYPSHIKQ
jgi:hypothetical protein